VRLNGRALGSGAVRPVSGCGRRPSGPGNLLEIEVTSVAANRIRDLDRRKVVWRNFHDINFVNLAYRPFDASEWPLTEAGLLGPVTITPVRQQ